MAPSVRLRRSRRGERRVRRRGNDSPNPTTSNRGKGAETGGAPREPTGSADGGPAHPRRLDEPLSHLHSASRRDDVADGGNHAGGTFRLPLSAPLGIARSRL